MINKRFSNPYVDKIKEFNGIVFDEHSVAFLIFGMHSSIILDIGCGNGEYLTDIASKNPDSFYIGFERQFKEVHRTALKIQKMGLKNCVVVSMNAADIPVLFGDGRLDGVCILFPDPWPKTKQKKNRLVQKKYIMELSSKIKKNGFIKIRTDNDDYFKTMLEVFYDNDVKTRLTAVDLSRDYHAADRQPKEYITPFERIFLRAGLLINYILLKRV